ncbi:MAG TPA: phosphatidylserine/phosphatidylglycerophosphate/cardiolipin synthase family protein [Burkholderiales bacterium]|nr:phosphatidylserine/phosphatidylglycerophosphate/cardiolipin synthase family protein [Burkholderiales bacterium]
MVRRRFLAASVVLLAACASPARGPDAEPRAALGAAPEGAYATADALFLRYRVDDRTLTLRASWPAEQIAPGRGAQFIAQLDVADDSTQALERELRAAAPVRLVDNARWQRIMTRVLEELAPAAEDRAVLLAVQGRDVAIFREAGRLRVVPFGEKPARVTIERAVSDEEFARRASGAVDEELGASAPSLIDVGGRAGDAYLYVDPARALSVYVVRPPDATAAEPGRPVGFALRTTEAVLLESHVLAPLKSPVSSSLRLLWQALQAGRALVPKGAGAAPGAAPAPPLATGSPMDLAAWETTLDELVSSRRFKGTLDFLIDGGEYFPRFVDAVQRARESVWLRVYIFDRDDYAVSIADLLRKRSSEVDVRVLLDQLGTLVAGQLPPAGPKPAGFRPPESIVDYLRAGSRVKVLSSPNPFLTSDHVKTLIVDRDLAFVGGMNIGREYRYEWHDMMAELRGPIVAPLASEFERGWARTSAGDVGFLFRPPAEAQAAPQPPAGALIDLRPLYTRTGQPEIFQAQLAAMRAARRTIWVEQPYLSDNQMLAGLIRARERGVDVRVVLPSRSDSGFMNSANLVASQLLVRNGVRVYAYPGMTHVKAAIYDGWACFGSANMDKLSLFINSELDLATSDPAAVARLRERLFEADFARSREITEAEPLGWNVYLSDFIARQL